MGKVTCLWRKIKGFLDWPGKYLTKLGGKKNANFSGWVKRNEWNLRSCNKKEIFSICTRVGKVEVYN
jgi:hypothetical protein